MVPVGMATVRAAVRAVLAIYLLGTLGERGQAQTNARPDFDAASIRLSDPQGGMAALLNPGSFNYRNYAVQDYIALAYNIQPYQLTHTASVSPGDLVARYDIIAKAREAVPVPQMKLMLQSLLADRFGLVFHRETKDLPAYILTVDKGGPRFKASEDEGPTLPMPIKDGVASYRRASMAYLTRMLSYFPSMGGRPVVDRTGLDGVYDLTMRVLDPGVDLGNFAQQFDERHDEWLKALGLRLIPQKASIEILVIDHLEKPSAN